MWTYLLDGSLDLSVTMTFISTVGAFLALPMWVYALARTIFQGNAAVCGGVFPIYFSVVRIQNKQCPQNIL